MISNISISSKLQSMKRRCYDVTDKNYPSYGALGVQICAQWHEKGKFIEWYRENEYPCDEPLNVDKDVLGGNDYSPETCLLIPQKLNNAFPKRKRDSGHTTGIQKRGSMYEVKVRNPFSSTNEYVGRYEDKNVAQAKYGAIKRMYLHQLLDTYKTTLPEKVYNAIFKSINNFEF